MADDVVPLFPMVDRSSRRTPPAEDPPTVAEAIGEVLREERTGQGRTLADVAESAAVSLPYLSEVERGRKEASSSVLRSIADALDLPLADVLERSADRLRPSTEASGRLRGEARTGRAPQHARSARTGPTARAARTAVHHVAGIPHIQGPASGAAPARLLAA